MEYCLTEGLERLSLHDSTLENYVRRGTSPELVFDWAKLANFIEHQVSEPIIMGQTTLVLTGIQAEELSIYEDGGLKALASLEALNNLEFIVENELSEVTKALKIGGMLAAAAGSEWVEWQLTFSTCTINWPAFITRTDWLSGLLPPG